MLFKRRYISKMLHQTQLESNYGLALDPGPRIIIFIRDIINTEVGKRHYVQ